MRSPSGLLTCDHGWGCDWLPTLYAVIQQDSNSHDGCRTSRDLSVHQEDHRVLGSIAFNAVGKRRVKEQGFPCRIVALNQESSDADIPNDSSQSLNERSTADDPVFDERAVVPKTRGVAYDL